MKTNDMKVIQQPKNSKNPAKHAWNKGKLLGQKPPLKLKEVWEIRIRLQLAQRTRGLALFNLTIDQARAVELVGGALITKLLKTAGQGNCRRTSLATFFRKLYYGPLKDRHLRSFTLF